MLDFKFQLTLSSCSKTIIRSRERGTWRRDWPLGQYTAMARKIFREGGRPEDIVCSVRSKLLASDGAFVAAASGLWQFITGTGSRVGCVRPPTLTSATVSRRRRARRTLPEVLHGALYNNWELAMGAYKRARAT